MRPSSSLHFINPGTGAYTNSIDSLWQKWYGTGRALLNLYMDKFVWKKLYESNALYHLSAQITERYSPPPGSIWKYELIYRLLIGLSCDRPIFRKSLIWRAVMQVFFQFFRPEREANYEYKCNISVNAQIRTKLSSLFLTRTNHQPPPDVLHLLPLHLTSLSSVTDSPNCSTLHRLVRLILLFHLIS